MATSLLWQASGEKDKSEGMLVGLAGLAVRFALFG